MEGNTRGCETFANLHKIAMEGYRRGFVTFANLDAVATRLAAHVLKLSVNELLNEYHARENNTQGAPEDDYNWVIGHECERRDVSPLDNATTMLVEDVLNKASTEVEKEYDAADKSGPIAAADASEDNINAPAIKHEDDRGNVTSLASDALATFIESVIHEAFKEIAKDYQIDEETKTAPKPVQINEILAAVHDTLEIEMAADDSNASPATTDTHGADLFDEVPAKGEQSVKKQKTQFRKAMKGARRRLGRLVVCGRKERYTVTRDNNISGN